MSSLASLGPADASESHGGLSAQRWDLANGNSISVTTRDGGQIEYVELDWGQRVGGEDAQFPGMAFGTTTLGDIRARLGSNGMAFSRRGPVAEMEGEIILLNTYEMSGVLVTFITAVSGVDLARASSEGPDAVARLATLRAVILTDPRYAESIWGDRVYSPDYQPTAWE